MLDTFTYTGVKYENQFHVSEFDSKKHFKQFFNENIMENSLGLININI
jgi:hypothetical protein